MSISTVVVVPTLISDHVITSSASSRSRITFHVTYDYTGRFIIFYSLLMMVPFQVCIFANMLVVYSCIVPISCYLDIVFSLCTVFPT